MKKEGPTRSQLVSTGAVPEPTKKKKRHHHLRGSQKKSETVATPTKDPLGRMQNQAIRYLEDEKRKRVKSDADEDRKAFRGPPVGGRGWRGGGRGCVETDRGDQNTGGQAKKQTKSKRTKKTIVHTIVGLGTRKIQ